MKAILALEDGTVFHGNSFGMDGEVIGEIVFNTGMTGYQEVITDPSYCGQIVTMTYPLIGNYGINLEDIESGKPQVRGLIVRELCNNPSNWRSVETLDNYLKKHGIMGIEGIDTRALTKTLREKGTMKGIISTDVDFNFDARVEEIKAYVTEMPVYQVTTREVIHYEGSGFRVALMDFGIKQNIIRSLLKRNCEIYIFPAWTKAEDILAVDPDGIVHCNGPGDTKECTNEINTIKQ
mgnify:FL=1